MATPACWSCSRPPFSPKLLSDPAVFSSSLRRPAGRLSSWLRPTVYFVGWVVGVVLLLAVPHAGHAQILDDSTKVLYGPRTVLIIREADVLRDTITPRMVDTTLVKLPQMRYWFYDSTFQQDLGNVGTASRQLLWHTNTQLGARLGRTAFDKYVINPATIPYYDTRSPYTYFKLSQGGTGESDFQLSYTRSLKKNFNVGAFYERITARKILATVSGKETLVDHSNVLIFMRYATEDQRYHALFNFSTARHNATEQGGIREIPDPARPNGGITVANDSLYNYQTATVWLNKASNRDDRDQLHLAHTYRLLGQGLTAFHILDYSRQRNRYFDDNVPHDTDTNVLEFYPRTLLNPTKTDDQAEYKQVENTIGILGSTPTVEYRAYARRRDASLTTKSLFTRLDGTTYLSEALPDYHTAGVTGQLFVGGTAAFQYRKFAVQTTGEYLLLSGEYFFQGTARLGPLTSEFLSTIYSPTLTEQMFRGNHYAWDNFARPDNELAGSPIGNHTYSWDRKLEFNNTKVNQLTARVDQKLGNNQLQASASVVNINSLVYYNQFAVPDQSGAPQQLLIFSARHQVAWRHWHADNQATFTTGANATDDNSTIIRIPSLVANLRAYYQSYIFHNALFTQVGASVYYQSRFRAYDYSPSTQQFYLQDEFIIRNYPLVNLFITADVKTVGVFLKVAYVNQGLYQNGYFASPYYTGLPRRIQFGIRWQFFN